VSFEFFAVKNEKIKFFTIAVLLKNKTG